MLLYFVLALLTSVVATFVVRFVSLRLQIVDQPDGLRKRHARAVPLLGGVSIFLTFWGFVLYLLYIHPIMGIEKISQKLLGAFFASCLLLLIGIIDDIRPISPRARLVVVVAAVALAITFGVGIEHITSPLGGAYELGLYIGNIVAFGWLLGMIFTVKILDGLDGLAAGVVFIGACVIFFLTQTFRFYQPNVGLVSLIFAGSVLGFLIFNFSPARIVLGESGGLLLGFMLGVLAIISGSKIATALLVMAVPIFDLLRVIAVRWRRGQSIFQGDREHLHYRLLTYGLSQRQVVLLFYSIALTFGLSTLFLQSYEKIIAFAILFVGMVLCGIAIREKKSNRV